MVARRKPRRKVANPTRYARETGKRLPRWREKLAAYEAEGDYFVHFSHYPKFGINPTNRYDTPTGFYAYPLRFKSIAAFAVDRPYVVVFRPGSGARLWDLSAYSTSQYRTDIDRLEDAFPAFGATNREKWAMDARVQTHAGRMWNITRMLAGRRVAQWTRILYSVLGYDGVADPCGGIVHPDEPCQAVFFDVRQLKLVDIINKGTSVDFEASPRVNLSGQDLSGRDLRNTKLANVAAIKTNFHKSDMRGARMKQSAFDGSDVDMEMADIHRARFVGADMRDANMGRVWAEGADFRRANLHGAYLYDADLRYADLRGTDLRKSNTNEANLRWAKRSTSDHPIRGWSVADGMLRRDE